MQVAKAPQLRLSEDRLSVTGYKGFRSVRANNGTHVGTWYCEARITHAGTTGGLGPPLCACTCLFLCFLLRLTTTSALPTHACSLTPACANPWKMHATLPVLHAAGHVRLGWCTNKAELQAPVGFDAHGYSYRDLEGSKVHQGLREPYGAGFKEGDVVGGQGPDG